MDSMTRERTTANSTLSGLAASFFPLPISRGCDVMSKHTSRSLTSVIRAHCRCPRQRLGGCFGPAVSIIDFNGLVHCVFADQALTYPAAGRRKTKPSDREAGARLGDHDPPTQGTGAERSARARDERARSREQLHPGLWPL